jgi:galactokinase
MNELETLLRSRFAERFGANPQVVVSAPGRVNIIGEHTDYNDGYVLPTAIGRRIVVAAAARDDGAVILCSGNLKGEVVFTLDAVRPSGDWGDYPKGIVAKLLERNYPIHGFDAFFLSNLPIGAGVSSSAAIEVAVCYLLQKLFGFKVPPDRSALLCQQAEHDFAGTRCGIMDQFVSVIGKSGHALFLDCRTLEYRHVPLSLGDYLLVACDSRVERGLVDSEYNRRRNECEQGVEALARRYGNVRALRDVTSAQLEECSAEMPEAVFRRCRHIVLENDRVLAAIDAMEANDLKRLGELMNRSHDSLRDDYEVSCSELDLLVSTAREVSGVLGSRLTGAGFGGSTISLVHRDAIDEFQTRLSESYLEAFNAMPHFFECVPSDGAEYAGNA